MNFARCVTIKSNLLRSLPSSSRRCVGQPSASMASAAAAHPASKIIHYDSKTCPYAQRSWIALLEKGLRFEIEQVDLLNKPEHFKAMYASIHPDPAASAKVPILIDGDTKLVESQIIVEYLDTKYRESGTQLIPADPAAAAKAKLFIDAFSTAVGGPAMGMLRADTAEAVAVAKGKLGAGLEVVDTCLRRHGSEDGGDYFLGGQFTIADVNTLTLLQRGIVALPVYRDTDLWQLMKERKLERLEKWARAVLERPSAKQTFPGDEAIMNSWGRFVVPLK